MGDIETDLLEWAGRQAAWQRDLLRRLATGAAIDTAELRLFASEAERIELAKPAAWVTEPALGDAFNASPLAASHLQITSSGSPSVCIDKIVHIDGANDLAPGATLQFAKAGLTIVAGRNGSGKSGYTRILKQVAASRGPERVLPNAFKPNVVPTAVIGYQVGDAPAQDETWSLANPPAPSPLQRVRVFDAKSATAQLASAGEVAYVPPSLQILADYTETLKSVADAITDDLQRAQLSLREWPALQIGIGTEIFENLGTKKGADAIARLVALSDEETTELEGLPARVQELTISDPAKLAVQARGRANQLSGLSRTLSTVSTGLNQDHVKQATDSRARVVAAEIAVSKARESVQTEGTFAATGSPKWRAMWLAAKDFVEEEGEHEFPDLSDGAVCALCQQSLEAVARDRFAQFAEFMKGAAQSELRDAQSLRTTNLQALNALPLDTAVTQDLVDLVGTYDKPVSELLVPLIARATALRDWLIEDEPSGELPEDPETFAASIAEVVDALDLASKAETDAAEGYGSSDSNALEAIALQTRQQGLELRQQLFAIKKDIEGQQDLTIRIARLTACLKTCDTTGASRQNTKLSKDYVDKVCEAFSTEAKALGLDRVPVKLVFDKSARGVSYIRVSLDGAPSISVPTVLSDGEQRVAAIAGFFADLTESGDGSTLVFDDPVSSLDQPYREAIARRLLLEANQRQVLVFSHDFTFVQYLYEQRGLLEKSAAAQTPAVPVAAIEYLHIARSKNGAGEPTTAEQWRHVSVGERIKRLNVRIQNAGVLYRAKDDEAYEVMARDIVGAIRETWEYLVEQELLDGIVQRHERAIQTQRLKRIVDIGVADVAAIDEGMSITSRWLTGHAAPGNDGTQVINFDQLNAEFKKLTDFRDALLARRKKM